MRTKAGLTGLLLTAWTALAGCSSFVPPKDVLNDQEKHALEGKLRKEPKAEVSEAPEEPQYAKTELVFETPEAVQNNPEPHVPRDSRFYELPDVVKKAGRFVKDWDPEGMMKYIDANARYLFDIVQLRTGEKFTPDMYMNLETKASVLFGSRSYFKHAQSFMKDEVDWMVHITGHEFDTGADSSRWYDSARHALRSEIVVELFRWMMYKEIAEKYDRAVGLEYISSLVNKAKETPRMKRIREFTNPHRPMEDTLVDPIEKCAPQIAALLLKDAKTSDDCYKIWQECRTMSEEDLFAKLGPLTEERLREASESVVNNHKKVHEELRDLRTKDIITVLNEQIPPIMDKLMKDEYRFSLYSDRIVQSVVDCDIRIPGIEVGAGKVIRELRAYYIIISIPYYEVGETKKNVLITFGNTLELGQTFDDILLMTRDIDVDKSAVENELARMTPETPLDLIMRKRTRDVYQDLCKTYERDLQDASVDEVRNGIGMTILPRESGAQLIIDYTAPGQQHSISIDFPIRDGKIHIPESVVKDKKHIEAIGFIQPERGARCDFYDATMRVLGNTDFTQQLNEAKIEQN